MKKGSSLGAIDSGRPEFVYFDLDDTLLDHRHAQTAALYDVATVLLGADRTSDVADRVRAEYEETNRSLWAEYLSGVITKDELRRRRFEHIAESFGDGRGWSEFDDFYMRRYAHHWRPIAGALEAFEQVAASVPVGIITNGFADTQHAKLDRFPRLQEISRAVVISEEVGYLKPDRRLFEYAERLSGAEGGSILYVGDSWRSDVLGALDAGWRAAWYSDGELPDDLPKGAFVFERWADLLRRLS